MFVLFVALVVMAGVILALALGSFEAGGNDTSQAPAATMLVLGLLGVFYLAMLIPMLAVTIRRFHDQDYSGWMVLLNFIPYLGGLIVFIFMCIEGTRGPNRFGPTPRATTPTMPRFSADRARRGKQTWNGC